MDTGELDKDKQNLVDHEKIQPYKSEEVLDEHKFLDLFDKDQQ